MANNWYYTEGEDPKKIAEDVNPEQTKDKVEIQDIIEEIMGKMGAGKDLNYSTKANVLNASKKNDEMKKMAEVNNVNKNDTKKEESNMEDKDLSSISKDIKKLVAFEVEKALAKRSSSSSATESNKPKFKVLSKLSEKNTLLSQDPESSPIQYFPANPKEKLKDGKNFVEKNPKELPPLAKEVEKLELKHGEPVYYPYKPEKRLEEIPKNPGKFSPENLEMSEEERKKLDKSGPAKETIEYKGLVTRKDPAEYDKYIKKKVLDEHQKDASNEKLQVAKLKLAHKVADTYLKMGKISTKSEWEDTVTELYVNSSLQDLETACKLFDLDGLNKSSNEKSKIYLSEPNVVLASKNNISDDDNSNYSDNPKTIKTHGLVKPIVIGDTEHTGYSQKFTNSELLKSAAVARQLGLDQLENYWDTPKNRANGLDELQKND